MAYSLYQIYAKPDWYLLFLGYLNFHNYTAEEKRLRSVSTLEISLSKLNGFKYSC